MTRRQLDLPGIDVTSTTKTRKVGRTKNEEKSLHESTFRRLRQMVLPGLEDYTKSRDLQRGQVGGIGVERGKPRNTLEEVSDA